MAYPSFARPDTAGVKRERLVQVSSVFRDAGRAAAEPFRGGRGQGARMDLERFYEQVR